MTTNWNARQVACDYCGHTLVVLRVGRHTYSEWRYRADDWVGAESHEAYHRSIESELRELVRKGFQGG